MEQLGILPVEIVGGESITKVISIDGRSSADGWALKYVFSDKDTTQVTCTSGDAGAFNLFVPFDITVKWPGGVIRFVAYVSKDTTTEAVDAGGISVTASPLAPKSWAQAALDAVEAVIAGVASSAQASMSIDGIAITQRSPEQLIELRNWLRAEARLAGANRPRRIIRTSFTGPRGVVYPLLPPVRMS
jgi:hypothetical protein